MIIDVHCHAGYSAWTVERTVELAAGAGESAPTIERFSFEPAGAQGRGGFDSYFSPRVMRKWGLVCRWRFVRQALGVDWRLDAGRAMDDQITAFHQRQVATQTAVDRIVLLAFDEYHTDEGRPLGPPAARAGRSPLFDRALGSDLYASNTLVRALCARDRRRFLLGASLHPYRAHAGRPAWECLPELKSAGAVLVKWLPLHMNIRASDPRTVAFLRAAHELNLAVLVHYGGEVTLALQHPQFIDPADMLDVLRRLRREGNMPTVIVAHAATPSTRLHSSRSCERFLDALGGEFRNAPLYADISGLSGPGRARWLIRLSRRRELHDKLVWATDFPIPPIVEVFAPWLGLRQTRRLRGIRSWFDRDLELKRALGFHPHVFTRAADLLDLPTQA